MKKCRYCQSEINVKAKICPHCRKRQSKAHIYIILIILLIGSTLTFNIIDIVKESKITKFNYKVEELFTRVQQQYGIEDFGKEYMCYRIDEDEYLGSVEVEYDEEINDVLLKIWLSNGTHYGSGEQDDVSIVKSNKTATTNCHND